MVEHVVRNDGVDGSNPLSSTQASNEARRKPRAGLAFCAQSQVSAQVPIWSSTGSSADPLFVSV